MSTIVPPEILALPVPQRMELAARIWDSIQPGEIEISEEHRRILDKRLADYEANPTEGRTWEEVKSELYNDK